MFCKYAANLQENSHACQSVISIRLLCNFTEITFWHGCSSVNLLHICRAPLPRNSSGWLLLKSFEQLFCQQFVTKSRKSYTEILINSSALFNAENVNKNINFSGTVLWNVSNEITGPWNLIVPMFSQNTFTKVFS